MNPAAEKKAIEIVDAFMDTHFVEQGDAAPCLLFALMRWAISTSKSADMLVTP